MFKGIRHVVWDWNGTLLDDVDAVLVSINTMLAERGLAAVDKAKYRRIFGFPVIDCYRVLGFEFSTDSEWEALAHEFHVHYDRNAASAGLTRGALEMLADLAERGLPMSILSAAELVKLRSLLEHYGIDDYFTHVFGHNDLYGSSKVALGRKLLDELGVQPDSVLLVGDTTHDCEVAADLGFQCALYLGGHQDEARLGACGCTLLRDITQLRVAE